MTATIQFWHEFIVQKDPFTGEWEFVVEECFTGMSAPEPVVWGTMPTEEAATAKAERTIAWLNA
jgi:hypothetical protein